MRWCVCQGKGYYSIASRCIAKCFKGPLSTPPPIAHVNPVVSSGAAGAYTSSINTCLCKHDNALEAVKLKFAAQVLAYVQTGGLSVQVCEKQLTSEEQAVCPTCSSSTSKSKGSLSITKRYEESPSPYVGAGSIGPMLQRRAVQTCALRCCGGQHQTQRSLHEP